MKYNIMMLLGLFVYCVTPTQIYSQEATSDTTMRAAPVQQQIVHRKMSFGLIGGYTLAFHNLDKTTIPVVPSCCSGYDSESGGGVVLAGLADFVISDFFNITTRLTYESSTVDLVHEQPITVRVDSQPRQATITYQNTSTISVLSLEPGIEYNVVGGLGVLGGLRIGVLSSATYDQSEKLDPTIPYDYAYIESGVRNNMKGALNNTSTIQFGLFFGARYHLGLNTRRTVELVPEVQFSPLFTNVLNDETWSISSLRFMLGITYSLFSTSDANPLAP